MIAFSEVETLPLVRAVYEECVKAGGLVEVLFRSDYLDHSLMRHGSRSQIGWVPEMEAYGMEWANVYFGLRGAHNLHEFADIPGDVLALHRRAMGEISSLRWKKTRWCLVRFPNEAFAQQAETDIETVMNLFFNSTLRDWSSESKRWREIAAVLNKGADVRLTGRMTDLRFSVKGRKWIVWDGEYNMPDGEISTAPVENTVSGHIQFERPAVLAGRLVNDIRLEWQEGRLLTASASNNEGFLRQVISSDDGSSKIGEFAIGTNYGIDRFCNDILFDEKIGGTVHIALGRAYAECGGTNVSSIHWDIVKDTRQEGAIYLDGAKVFENGHFTV